MGHPIAIVLRLSVLLHVVVKVILDVWANSSVATAMAMAPSSVSEIAIATNVLAGDLIGAAIGP